MVENDQITGNILELENLLVKQLRALQEFVELTRREREALLDNRRELMGLVEDKEALLDKIGLAEDSRRKIIQELAVALELQNGDTSIKELLPHLPPREIDPHQPPERGYQQPGDPGQRNESGQPGPGRHPYGLASGCPILLN